MPVEIQVSNIEAKDVQKPLREDLKRVRFDVTVLVDGVALVTLKGFLYDHYRQCWPHHKPLGYARYYFSEVSDDIMEAIHEFMRNSPAVNKHLGPKKRKTRKIVDVEGGKEKV